jgi:hypothetical protein
MVSAAPTIMILICAIRGLVSFDSSFGVITLADRRGYEGALNICAIVMGAGSSLGSPFSSSERGSTLLLCDML